MLGTFTRLLRTPAERSAFAYIAAALLVTALGAGIMMSVWAHWVATRGYVPSTGMVELSERYLRGEPGAVLFTVVLGPLREEVLVRGLLLTVLLWFYRPWVAVTLSALAFGAGHLNLVQFVPGVLMGLALGAVYARTGSLTLCWLGHAAYNAQYWLAHAVLAVAPPG
jgi:membrane protease YdiL (CAAX protease family)